MANAYRDASFLYKRLYSILTYKGLLSLLIFAYRFSDDEDRSGSQKQTYASHYEHVTLYTSYQREQKTTYSCGYNLRNTYRTVEQSQIDPHVTTVKSVGHDGERHGKHCRPSAPYQ